MEGQEQRVKALLLPERRCGALPLAALQTVFPSNSRMIEAFCLSDFKPRSRRMNALAAQPLFESPGPKKVSRLSKVNATDCSEVYAGRVHRRQARRAGAWRPCPLSEEDELSWDSEDDTAWLVRDGRSAAEQPWACLTCTFENSVLLPACEMCEQPRGAPLLKLQSPGRRQAWLDSSSEWPSLDLALPCGAASAEDASWVDAGEERAESELDGWSVTSGAAVTALDSWSVASEAAAQPASWAALVSHSGGGSEQRPRLTVAPRCLRTRRQPGRRFAGDPPVAQHGRSGSCDYEEDGLAEQLEERRLYPKISRGRTQRLRLKNV